MDASDVDGKPWLDYLIMATLVPISISISPLSVFKNDENVIQLWCDFAYQYWNQVASCYIPFNWVAENITKAVWFFPCKLCICHLTSTSCFRTWMIHFTTRHVVLEQDQSDAGKKNLRQVQASKTTCLCNFIWWFTKYKSIYLTKTMIKWTLNKHNTSFHNLNFTDGTNLWIETLLTTPRHFT